MKKLRSYSAIYITCILFTSLLLHAEASDDPPVQKKGKWKLVWQDEFSYTGLPDSAKWGYESGHIRNEEQQYYMEADSASCFVSDGMLRINGRKRIVSNNFYTPGSDNWRTKDSLAYFTSASINTLGKVNWQYGKVEIRAKLPVGRGVWPAFWMMGINRELVKWPQCGEIDIMEYIGSKDSTTIYGTIHRDNERQNPSYFSTGETVKCNTIHTDFHIYSLEWDEKYIDIHFDGKRFFRYKIEHATRGSGENPFRKPFYLLINLALGAAWPGKVHPDDLPATLILDYVRVYQKKY